MLLSAGLLACGGDEPQMQQSDAGNHCNPTFGGVDTCYCTTGTAGVRYCRGIVGQATWSACSCNEPYMPPMCMPNDHVSCECPDGTVSYQVCRAYNTLDPCMCSGHMDSGVPDASSQLDSGHGGTMDSSVDASDIDATS
jgi:hypothetical protein